MQISRSHAWTLWAVVSFFYAYQYILRVCPSILMGDIIAKFSLTSADFGSFCGIYYIGYAVVHVPIGLLLDRYSPKWVIPSFIMLSVIGFLPLVFFETWAFSVMGRLLVGVGSSAAILSVFKIIRMNFDDQKFARYLGFSVMVGLLGAIYGSRPVSQISEAIGWENVIFGFFGLGVVLAIITFLCIPSNAKDSNTPEIENPQTIFQDMKEIFSNYRVLLTALFAALMVGPMEGFADVWGVSFLENVYGFDKSTATTLPSFIFLGMCFGSPLLAYVAERTGAYYRVTQVSAFIMGGSFMALFTFSLSPFIVGILFTLIGVMCAYQVLIMYMNSKNAPERLSSVVIAMTNMVIMSFGYVFHYTIGHLMDWAWDGKVVEGIPVYDANAYLVGLSVIPLGLMIGFVGFIFLSVREKKT